MKICVTGATGFIGVNLTLMLAGDGHTVHVLCRSESKAALVRHANVKIFMGDILNEGILSDAVATCDVVYHLAAYAKPWSRDPAVYYDVNVRGTKVVLDTAEKLHVKKVIIVSTAGVFGPSLNGILISEKTIPSVGFFTEYDRTKALADELVKAYASSGPEIIHIHPTRVYGPGLMNESNSLTIIIHKYIAGKWHIIPSDGESRGNYVYIDDVVRGLVAAMDKGRMNERYILGGDNVTFNEFFTTLGRISGQNHRLYHLPYAIMMALSKVMVFMASFTGLTPPITPGFVKRYHYNWNFSSAKAEKELGYRITPLEEGIKKTMEWLKQKY